MATESTQSKLTTYQQLILGLQKNAPNLVLILASTSYTTAQIIVLLQSLIASADDVLTTKTAWHDAVVANTKLETQYAPLVSELKQQIGLMYSNAETTLAQFGLTPKKPRKPLSGEAIAIRAAKAAATRKARGTTSKKQKAGVTGNVTGMQFVPITSGSSGAASTSSTSSAPTAAPVASAAPAGASAVGSSGSGAAAPATATPVVSSAPGANGSAQGGATHS